MFALSTYPLHLALQWWHRRFGTFYEPLQTEQDTQGGSSDVDTSEVPTSFLGSSSGPGDELDVELPETATIQLPPKVTSETPQPQLSNAARSHNSGPRIPNTLHNRNSEASSSTNSKKETRRQRPLPSSQKGSKVVTADSSSAVNSANIEATRHRTEGEASSRHQIWHPPRSSYIDDGGEDQVDLTLRPSDLSVPSKDLHGSQEETFIAHEQKELDEWRQYPPFPSAYPPTPLVVTSRLAAASIVRSNIYPAIEEERSQQDFQKSLLPPREPLNPSPAGDSSDQSFTFGISPYHLARQATTTDEADDSMSTDEDEDGFNRTLRTPLQLLGSRRSQLHPKRLVSLASGSSAVPSRLSTLTTTADDGSSLRTRTSSETLSASESIPVSVIGRKRSYPRTKPNNIKNRVYQIEDRGPDEIADPDPLATVPSGTRHRPNAIVKPDTGDTVDDPESSLKSSAEELDKAPEEKRRKVIRSSTRVAASRSNIKRHIPPPPQTRKSKVTEPVATKRLSSRMKSGSRTYPVEASLNTLSSESASTSDLTPPPVPSMSNTRQTRSKIT
jgi:hypothetical protein